MSIISLLVLIVHFVARLLFILILAHVILSYFMDPYHPIRRFIDRIVTPMLVPIRRVVPTFQMLDFSPIILLILIQVIESLLVQLIISLG